MAGRKREISIEEGESSRKKFRSNPLQQFVETDSNDSEEDEVESSQQVPLKRKSCHPLRKSVIISESEDSNDEDKVRKYLKI